MKNSFGVILFLSFLTTLSAQAAPQSCKNVVESLPVTQEGPLFKDKKSHCLQIQKSFWKICKVRVAEATEVWILDDQKRVHSYPAASLMGDLEDFDARKVEIAGSGSALFVANRESESNGIAIQKWQIRVFPISKLAPDMKSTPLEVEDYGKSSLVQENKDSKDCRVLKTSWTERQGHQYFTGQVMRFSSEKWEPDPKAKPLEKKFTHQVEQSRLKLKTDASRRIHYDPLQILL